MWPGLKWYIFRINVFFRFGINGNNFGKTINANRHSSRHTVSVRGWRQIILNCNIDLLFIQIGQEYRSANEKHDKYC